GGIEEYRIGETVIIEISPDELPRVTDSSKGVERLEGPVAIVAEHQDGAGATRNDDIEIAVGFDVGRPGAAIVAIENVAGKACLAADILVGAVELLPKAKPAGAGQEQVRPESIVPIDGQNAGRRRRDVFHAAGKGQGRTVHIGSTHFSAIR